MKRRFGIYLVILLASTLFSAYSLNIFPRTKLHGYLRSFSGGVILSLITLRILPRVYTQHSSFLAPFVSGVVFLALFALEQLLSEDTGMLYNKRRYNAALSCATISIQSLQEGFGIFRAAEEARRWFVLRLIGYKWLEGLTLGCVVFDDVFSGFTEHLCVHVYSLSAPLGMVLGTICKKGGPACLRGPVEHLCTGALTGCLFYVGFIERIVSEFSRSADSLGRAPVICIVVSGFLVASCVSYAVDRLCGGCCEECGGESVPCQQ